MTNKPTWLAKLIETFHNHDVKNEAELIEILQSAEDHKLIDHDSHTMIEGVLNVSKMTVEDIMIPRSQIVTLQIGQKLSDILPTVIKSSHSRFPVISENKDNVIGILLAKDLLKFYVRHEQEGLKLEEQFLRKAVFVPESKHLDSLLKEFRLSHNHLAIVVDEYGNVSGVVTIEDVLEQIVGDIEDEFDKEDDSLIKAIGNNKYEVDALTLIEDFNEHFNSNLPDNQVDTIGGLLMNHCGYVPKTDEQFTIEHFTFAVLNADNRRVHQLLVTINA